MQTLGKTKLTMQMTVDGHLHTYCLKAVCMYQSMYVPKKLSIE